MMKINFKKLIPLVFILLTSLNCSKKGNKINMAYPLALLGGQKNDTGGGVQPTNPAPSSLVYTTSSGSNSTVLTVGSAVSISPTFTGAVTSCTISPSLPEGLSLNPTTCAITGTPTSAFPQTTFTITATNQHGSTTAQVTLSATANPPSNLTIPGGNTQTFTTGAFGTITPTFSGSITSCRISPSLPSGLVLNPTTCAISGTPTTVSPNIDYTITASNQFGSTSIVINFGVNTLAPQNLAYPFGTSTTINTNQTVNITPSVIGGVTSCNVNPSLPQGLVLNQTTCAITGTPTVDSPNTAYTITASNQHGSSSILVSIATPLVAPTGFSFPLSVGVPTIYTIGSPVSVTPAITGVVSNCTVSPSLPSGLVLNSITCAITGTPTSVSSATNYTITATNGSGSVNTVVQLQINNVPPSNLVYPFGSSVVLPVGTAQSITPTFLGGVTSCSANPSLPTGLSINATTCTISGTPSAKVATNYTITASNSFGSTNVIVNIAATLFAPSNLTYPYVGNGTIDKIVFC